VLQDAVDRFRQCGERELADDIEAVLVGRNVIDDHWSFELVEDYDAGYWSVFRAVEEYTRTRLGVPEHCLEAEMKSAEQFER
jgi:hypothetical protein